MARTVRKAFDRRVATEAKTIGARPADRPPACLRAEVKQRASTLVADRFFRGHSFHLGAEHPEDPHLALQRSVARAWLTRDSVVTPRARQAEARELADHRIAGNADLTRDLAAGAPGVEKTFEFLNAVRCPVGEIAVGGIRDIFLALTRQRSARPARPATGVRRRLTNARCCLHLWSCRGSTADRP